MSKQIDKMSVFLPIYNEQANIKNTYNNVKENLEKNVKEYEIILVDDGSKDKTPQICDDIAKKDKNVRVIHHNPNMGYGGAVKSGLYASSMPWIAFIDSDGQFNFEEINRFIETQQKTGADCVIGYYRDRKVSAIRKLNSKVWQTIVNILFGLNVRDIDCAFKLVSKKVIETIPPLESTRGAFITSEFLIKAKKSGFKIVEIGVNHYPRKQGEATGAKLNVIIQSFVDLFNLWKKLR